MTVVLVILVAVLALALLAAVHLYVWRRLVRDTTGPGTVRRVGAGVVVALGVSMAGALILPKAFGPRGTEWIAWPGFVWMALLLYVVLALGVLEIPRVLALRALRRRAADDEPATARLPVTVAVGPDGADTAEPPTATTDTTGSAP
ncbi:metallophosphoesterase, partial [Streptomyces sp. SID3343]|nr:metallophosphoesterase [Streptomyces sp. SID3343]